MALNNDFLQRGMDELDSEGGSIYPDDDFLGAGGNDFDSPGSAGGFGDEPGGDPEFDFSQAEGTDEFDRAASGGMESTQGGKAEVLHTVKKVIPILLIALVVIVVLIGLVSRRGKAPATPTDTDQPLQTQEVQQPITDEPPVAPVEPQPDQPAVVIPEDGWVWVEHDSEVKFSQPIEGVFTVTSIKLMSKVIESRKTLALKSIVTGSISGVSGTYDFEIPYNKALNLEVGTQLYITYRIGEKGSVQYVSDVEF